MYFLVFFRPSLTFLHHCGVVDADGHGDQIEHHEEEAVPLNQLHGIPHWVAESTSVSPFFGCIQVTEGSIRL